MTDNDQSHLLLFLAAPRMAHAVLAELKGDELVIFERLDKKTPPEVADEAHYFGLDYSDGTGHEEMVIKHMIDKQMIELKYDGYKGYFKITEFGQRFALAAAQNVVLARAAL